MPTFTLTRPGDSWHTIALEYYGYHYCEQNIIDLLNANSSSIYYWNHYYQLQNAYQHDVHCCLPEYRAIWLPKNNCCLAAHDETLLRLLDCMPLTTRENLSILETVGISPHYVLAAAQFAQLVQKQNAKYSKEQTGMQKTSLAMGLAFMDQTGDQLKDEVKEVVEKILILNKAVIKNAANSLFIDEVQQAYNDASAALNKGILRLANKLVGFKLDTQERLLRAARNARYFRRWRGFTVYSLEAMENLKGLERFLNIMMPSGVVSVDILMEIVETVEAYENKKDWKEVGFGAAGEIAGNIFGGRYLSPTLIRTLPQLIERAIPSLAETNVADEELTLLGIADASELGIEALATAEVWIPVIVGSGIAVAVGYAFEFAAKKGYQKIRKDI